MRDGRLRAGGLGCLWGASAGDAKEVAFLSQAPSHKEKKERSQEGGTAPAVRWLAPALRVPGGGAGPPRSPRCRSDPRSFPHRSAVSPQRCPGPGTAPAPLSPAGQGCKAGTDSSAWHFLRHRLCFLHVGTLASQEHHASAETQLLRSVSHGAPLTWARGTCAS